MRCDRGRSRSAAGAPRARACAIITLSNFYNGLRRRNRHEVRYRQGVVKLLNSLSPQLRRAEDAHDRSGRDHHHASILTNSAWTSDDWETIWTEVLSVQRCSRTPRATRNLLVSVDRTGKMPSMCARLVRLHRLAAAALRQAAEAAAHFRAGEGGRRRHRGNIERFIAQRSGFQKSGVSPEQPPDRAASYRAPAISGPRTTSRGNKR